MFYAHQPIFSNTIEQFDKVKRLTVGESTMVVNLDSGLIVYSHKQPTTYAFNNNPFKHIKNIIIKPEVEEEEEEELEIQNK